MKTKTIYSCQNCGAQFPRWVGKCTECGSWNSIVEEIAATQTNSGPLRAVAVGGHSVSSGPVLLQDVSLQKEKRLQTLIEEFDRVLGGGIVPGSVTLIGGDPGIGKSTLSLQATNAVAGQGLKILYVSGEESIQQTKLRADRVTQNLSDTFYIVNQLDINVIIEYIEKIKPALVVIDSIQVVYHSGMDSSPGSVSQVRECAAILTQLAKSKGFALFIIGHVTKEGAIAGPRVLEHIVDTVLYFEGERYSAYRILRANKNRFGSTNEIGVFEMVAEGLKQVHNPSEIFLSERPLEASGSVVIPIVEGTRPFLVETQGLVSRSTFGMVRQKAQGFDGNRLALLVAVLEKRIGLNVQDKDIFLNVVGGVRILDPAADLGVCLAIASALLDKIIPHDTVVLGEVGLSAEVRRVSQISPRINEAQKLGFKRCLVPKNNLKFKGDLSVKNIDIIPVTNVREALDKI